MEMKANRATESIKLDRGTVEKNRRIHMKGLCFELASLMPPHYFKSSQDMLSQHDVIGQATAYINRLKESIQELKTRKELAARSDGWSKSRSDQPPSSILPVVKMGLWDSGLEVTLISGMDKRFTLSEAISILQEEGAEAVRASVSTVGEKIFHTIFAQAILPRIGVDTSRVGERLHKLVFSL